MKKNKGFTLVELLAVIVILAVILVIAVPQIISTITESRKGALISSAKLIAASAESAKLSNDTLGIEKPITCSDVSKLNSEDYESCTITFDSNGKAKVTIVGKGKFEGMSVCSATRETGEVSSECSTDVACFAYEEVGKQITGYDINEEACKEYAAGQGTPTDVAETLCTGGEVGGSSLKGSIDAAIQDGSEEAISWISGLETEGVISIVQYVDGISITGYGRTCPKDVVIPSKIDNKNVIAIGNDAFTTGGTEPNQIRHDLLYQNYEVNTLDVKDYSENTLQPLSTVGSLEITSVTIPDSVTTIGDYAFSNNQLASVIIPNSVTTVGGYAFEGNQLTSITIPNSVTTIADWAFSDNQITSVTIPNSVTTIGYGAFYNNQLTSVTIPNSVTTIGGSAFEGNQLTSITIPNSVTTIGDRAFNNNKLSDSDAYIYKRNSDGSIDNTYVVSYGGAEKDITIPNSVTTIGNFAFFNNQLTSVVIPSSVTSIGNYAFFKHSLSNPNLTSIINTTGRSFDWKYIITGISGTSSVTGTYNGVNVTTE